MQLKGFPLYHGANAIRKQYRSECKFRQNKPLAMKNLEDEAIQGSQLQKCVSPMNLNTVLVCKAVQSRKSAITDQTKNAIVTSTLYEIKKSLYCLLRGN
jgi:hypothetical protein